MSYDVWLGNRHQSFDQICWRKVVVTRICANARLRLLRLILAATALFSVSTLTPQARAAHPRYTITGIGSPSVTSTGKFFSAGSAINNHGQVAGVYGDYLPDGSTYITRSFLFD